MHLIASADRLRMVGPRPVALERLLAQVGGGFSETHTSAHWQQHAPKIRVVAHAADDLELVASGFPTLTTAHRWRAPLHTYERWTYRHATRALPAFADIWAQASALADRLGVQRDYDLFRQACALATVAPYVGLSSPQIAIIGDGAGVLGVLTRLLWPAARLWVIDFPAMLTFQVSLHAAADLPLELVTAVTPEQADRLPPSLDLAMQLEGFQEMTPAVVASYFRLLQTRGGLLYCLNRDEKTFRDGTVSRFDEYPWPPGRPLVDGPCPFVTHQYVFRPYPHRVTFDGVHRHRLIQW